MPRPVPDASEFLPAAARCDRGRRVARTACPCDPGRTSYRNILEFFFQIRRPDLGEGAVGCDYRSEIFYTSDEQRQIAEDAVAGAPGFWDSKVMTKISEAGPFWEAEAGDQDYFQRYTDGNNQFSPYRSVAR
jgi:peptide-methionine (S)-S-oxide reductase